MLIEQFKPAWNLAIDGFGNKDPGQRRKDQYCSPWDVIHPGRKFAEKLGENPRKANEFVADLKSFLKPARFRSVRKWALWIQRATRTAMRHNDVTIQTVGELLTALKTQSSPSGVVWFRGQAVSDWSLVPSLARKASHLKAETALIKRFQQNAAPHLESFPKEEWEWMFLMQHHRAPTRLLDWSESPLTALFFAVNEDKHKRKDAAVWCLDPVDLNASEARIDFRNFPNEIPAFGIDKVLENYIPSRVDEAPNVMSTVAIVGPRNTARMAAQLGVFTINHRDHHPLEGLGAKQHVWRWIVPAAAKKELRRELALLGFTALTLFPELDRVADVAKELLQ